MLFSHEMLCCSMDSILSLLQQLIIEYPNLPVVMVKESLCAMLMKSFSRSKK